MKYYSIQKSNLYKYDAFGTSKLGISTANKGLIYNLDSFLEFDGKLRLDVYAEAQEIELYFLKYVQQDTYISLMIPELKVVFEQFNMPEYRWYEAEAGYNKGFVDEMKKYFKIDYDIDINEKRDYWILQILGRRREELAFDVIDHKYQDYDFFKDIEGMILKRGTINNYEEYRNSRKYESVTNNRVPEPMIYKYRKNYDILWGGINIVFNEKVKTALEATGIICAANGLEFAEFTEYQIEMLGEVGL